MEWISLNERSPEHQQYVLVHYDKAITDLDENWTWNDVDSRTIVAKKNGFWTDANGEGIIEPTHWMELPKPPEK